MDTFCLPQFKTRRGLRIFSSLTLAHRRACDRQSKDRGYWSSQCKYILARFARCSHFIITAEYLCRVQSVSGFLFLLVVLGIVVDRVRSLCARYRELHFRIIQRDHVLILGWNDKTLFLIRELCNMYDSTTDHSRRLALIGSCYFPYHVDLSSACFDDSTSNVGIADLAVILAQCEPALEKR